MKPLSRYLFVTLLVFLAIISATGIYLWRVKGLRYYSVQSSSMSPALQVGDLVIDEKTNPTSLKAGDIVSYGSLANPGVVITHRVISVNTANKQVMAKGDNLSAADPPVPSQAIKGKVTRVVPYAGYLLDALRNPFGLVAIVYVPVIAIGLVEARRVGTQPNTYKHPKII